MECDNYFFSFVSFRNSKTFLPLCWNTSLWHIFSTCICSHLQRNQPDTRSTSFPYRTSVFIFAAQYWGMHDLLFAVLGTAWSPVLQYRSMHGCQFALLWYKLSFLNLCHIWRRLEAVASLLWSLLGCDALRRHFWGTSYSDSKQSKKYELRRVDSVWSWGQLATSKCLQHFTLRYVNVIQKTRRMGAHSSRVLKTSENYISGTL